MPISLHNKLHWNVKKNDISKFSINSAHFFGKKEFSKAIKYIDLPKFVHNNLRLLKEGLLTGQGAKIRYDDLVEIKEVLETSVKI
jgi:hypothetical protein